MKKFASILVAVVLVLGMAINAAAATIPGAVYGDQQAEGVNKPVAQVQQELQKAGVKDVKATDWYAGSVTVVVQAGLLPPSSDGKFHPEAKLSTATGVAVFAKVLGIAGKTDSTEAALNKAKEAGLITSTANSNKDMSRLEVARLLASALNIKPATLTSSSKLPFGDCSSLSASDQALLKALYDAGIFKGSLGSNGKLGFNPTGTLTNAQIAILIDRILGAK